MCVPTVNHSRVGVDKNFKLKASGPNGLKAEAVGTITNNNQAETTPSTTQAPTPTTTTTVPPPGLTVSSPTAREGSDLVFRVTLTGRSGRVSWLTIAHTASQNSPGRDFVPLGADNASADLTDGVPYDVPVETLSDNIDEDAETVYLSVRGPGDLKARGTGTITDGPVAPTPPRAGGGWSNYGACDAGIRVVAGYSPAAGSRHWQQVLLPMYDPDLKSGHTLVSKWGSIPAHNDTYRPPNPRHWWKHKPPRYLRSGYSLGEFILKGTVHSSVRRGEYPFNVKGHWRYRYTVGSQGRTRTKEKSVTYPCKVIVLPDSRSTLYAPACPAVYQFRRGEIVSESLTSVRDGVSFSASWRGYRPPGLSVVKDGTIWYLRGVPTRNGSYSLWLSNSIGTYQRSVRCRVVVHNRAPITVTAVDMSFTEGDFTPDSMPNPNWRGWASVSLSRAPLPGEGRVLVYVRVRDQRSGSQRNTAERFVPQPPAGWRAEYLQWWNADSSRRRCDFDCWLRQEKTWDRRSQTPDGTEDWRPPLSSGDDGRGEMLVVGVPEGQTSRVSSSLGHAVFVYGDQRVEQDEHFWWQITRVTGAAVVGSGDAAWGKATIDDDDSNPPEPPEPCVPPETEDCEPIEPPWRLTPENVGMSRPSDSIIVGLPVVFYLKNVKTSCLPDAPPKTLGGWCGTDIWPSNERAPSQWAETGVVWSANSDGDLEGYTFKADRIVIEDGDPYEPSVWECTNVEPTYNNRGKSAPGRRYVFTRNAPADDEPGAGECSFEYQEWGSYTLKVQVVWRVFRCAGPDADSDGVPETSTLSCSSSVGLTDTTTMPVEAARIIQRIIDPF